MRPLKHRLGSDLGPLKRAQGLYKFFPVTTRDEHLESNCQAGLKQRECEPDAIEQRVLANRLSSLEKSERKREQSRLRKQAQRLRDKAKVS